MGPPRVTYSVSTWRQPVPEPGGPERSAVIRRLVDRVLDLGSGRLRVAVDGRTAAGKTSLGHEIAVGVVASGRPVFRASLDDFKRPWSEADRYDRISGEGYYRNAFDVDAIRQLLLDPAAPSGDGVVALCSIDPLTQLDHSRTTVQVPDDGVLVVDGVFACRPELDDAWDLRVWLEVDAACSLRRGVERDTEIEGGRAAAEDLHRSRYQAAEEIYLDEVRPRSFADVVIDNSDLARPRLLRLPH